MSAPLRWIDLLGVEAVARPGEAERPERAPEARGLRVLAQVPVEPVAAGLFARWAEGEP